MEIYEKNLASIKINRPKLYEALRLITTNERFEVFLPNEQRYANLLDTKNDFLFYSNSIEDDLAKQKQAFEKYKEYPFLYCFGIANGALAEYILENKKLQQLVVVEPEIELIYIALNLIDFSSDLATNRLLILLPEELTPGFLPQLFFSANAKFYVKVFTLLQTHPFYERFYNDTYIDVYKRFIETLEFVATANGNDITDTFRGVKQHIQNLDLMLEHYRLSELLRKKNSDLAVIVSTGPSLTKQLPLLKEYQDKVTIISVDASYPILIRNGIKPDIVTTMERDKETAEFFSAVEKRHRQDIVFLCASLQHKAVFETLSGSTMVIAMRPFEYNTYFGMHEYGYICKGMSSANMAHELAAKMGYKQCVFIGQDLAYAPDASTHAKGHIFPNYDLLDDYIKNETYIEVEAYGGNGTVKTNEYWLIFKQFIEQLVDESQGVMVNYNATEGGARIRGTIEKPFAEVLESFALSKPKDCIVLEDISQEEKRKNKIAVQEKLKTILQESKTLQESVNKTFLKIAQSTKKVENLSKEEALEALSVAQTYELLQEISFIRDLIEKSDIYKKFLYSIIQPLLYNMELELAEIKVRYVDNPQENQLKALQWILAHRFWLFSFSGVIDNVVHLIEETQLLKARL